MPPCTIAACQHLGPTPQRRTNKQYRRTRRPCSSIRERRSPTPCRPDCRTLCPSVPGPVWLPTSTRATTAPTIMKHVSVLSTARRASHWANLPTFVSRKNVRRQLTLRGSLPTSYVRQEGRPCRLPTVYLLHRRRGRVLARRQHQLRDVLQRLLVVITPHTQLPPTPPKPQRCRAPEHSPAREQRPQNRLHFNQRQPCHRHPRRKVLRPT